jgi:hemophore-related protein
MSSVMTVVGPMGTISGVLGPSGPGAHRGIGGHHGVPVQHVNAFLTDLEGAPRDTVKAKVDEYMTANSQVQEEFSAIRRTMVDMRNRCGGSSDDES